MAKPRIAVRIRCRPSCSRIALMIRSPHRLMDRCSEKYRGRGAARPEAIRPHRPPDFGQNGPVRVSAKADYAVRAMLELVDASSEEPAKGELVSEAQAIPA